MKTARRLRTLVRGRGRSVVSLALVTFAGGLAEAAFLVVITRCALAISNGRQRAGLLAGIDLDVPWALAGSLVLVLIRVGFALIGARVASSLVSDVTASTRRAVGRGYMFAEWSAQQGDRPGRLQELVSNHPQRVSEVMYGLTSWIAAVLSLLAMMGSAVLVDPVASLGMLVGMGLLGSVLRPVRSRLRRQAGLVAASGLTLATTVTEVAAAAQDLHVFGVQKAALARIEARIDENAQQARRLIFLRSVNPVVYSGLAFGAVALALWAISFSDSLAVGSVGAVMLVILRSLSYGQAVQVASAAINSSLPYLDLIEAELERLGAAQLRTGGDPIGTIGSLAFDDVHFSYQPDEPVLRGLSFEIRPGEVVGVVGPSGSGKSTMVQLMLGLREPSSGHVLAAGRPVRSLDPAEWCRKVTFVPQQAHLVAGTVADNIRFFREDVSDDEIERASRLANLHEDVQGWPDGYQRQVGEMGGQLSGGQQQRLAIARALVERPELLVLDEPTSALDVRSEQLIKQTLENLRGTASIVIIAHRLSTLDRCDRIMVIQGGELRGFDTPARLAQDSEFYRNALELSGLKAE